MILITDNGYSVSRAVEIRTDTTPLGVEVKTRTAEDACQWAFAKPLVPVNARGSVRVALQDCSGGLGDGGSVEGLHEVEGAVFAVGHIASDRAWT
jgi:hypothetical protein